MIRRPLPVIFTILVVGLSMFYVMRNTSYGLDDSFITYRYADNLREGHGLVFNLGERHYGSTAMGLAILLAIVSKGTSWFGFDDIVAIAHILSALSLAGIAVVLHRILIALVGPSWPAYAASCGLSLFIFAASVSNDAVGHETYPFLALLALGGFLIFFGKQYRLGALCVGLSVMLRPDCVLFLAIAFLVLVARHYLVKDTRIHDLLNIAIVSGTVVISWAIFTKLYFGSAVPETLVAKQAQITLGYWPIFRLKVIGERLLDQMTIIVGALLSIGTATIVAGVYAMTTGGSGRRMSLRADALCWSLTWLLFAIGLTLAYRQFKVTYWSWYFDPIYLSMLFSTVVATADLASRHQRFSRGLAVLCFAAVLLDGPTIIGAVHRWILYHPRNLHLESYDPIIAWLRIHEPNGTIVATGEPGGLGYKLGPRFRVVDELGLASPGVARHIIAGDLDYPIRRWKPDYVVVSFPGKFNPHERWWFDRVYKEIGEFSHPYWRETIQRGALLYQRVAEPALVLDSRRSP